MCKGTAIAGENNKPIPALCRDTLKPVFDSQDSPNGSTRSPIIKRKGVPLLIAGTPGTVSTRSPIIKRKGVPLLIAGTPFSLKTPKPKT